MLTSSVVDRGFELQKVKTKDYNIGFCSFSDKHTVFSSKKEHRLVGSESGYCVRVEAHVYRRLLFHLTSTTTIQLSTLV